MTPHVSFHSTREVPSGTVDACTARVWMFRSGAASATTLCGSTGMNILPWLV